MKTKLSETNEEKLASIRKLVSTKSVRVVKKNLVYLIGLHPDWVKEKLVSNESLSIYGEIQKMVFNNEKSFSVELSTNSFCSAYVTYCEENSAALAILALNNFEYKNTQLKANYGMTKYCSYFLKGKDCHNKDCLFMHKIAEPEETFTKVQL